jgi:hypothetical protein
MGVLFMDAELFADLAEREPLAAQLDDIPAQRLLGYALAGASATALWCVCFHAREIAGKISLPQA